MSPSAAAHPFLPVRDCSHLTRAHGVFAVATPTQASCCNIDCSSSWVRQGPHLHTAAAPGPVLLPDPSLVQMAREPGSVAFRARERL